MIRRSISTKSIPTKAVVDLAFHHVHPSASSLKKHPGPRPVLVNLHGIFGSSAMFRSISKPLADELDMEVYSVDLRNHGDSPWAFPYDFLTHAKDVIHFIKTNIGTERPVNLLGFSIGGKIGLLTTLCHQVNVTKCVSMDLPPYETPQLDDVVLQNYALIMKIINREIKIKRGTPNWKQLLLSYFKALPANQVNNGDPSLYFAAGFYRVKKNGVSYEDEKAHRPIGDPYIDYYLPLKQFPALLDSVKAWPDLSGKENSEGIFQESTDRSVLFMRALKSGFMKDDYSLLYKPFPNAKVCEFDTGHNMMVEEPKKTLQCIKDYLKD